jgi:addiction module RelB/DinJ family antitoxin
LSGSENILGGFEGGLVGDRTLNQDVALSPEIDMVSRFEHSCAMAKETVLLRTRVPARRLKRTEKVLEKLGLTPGDAVNMMLAQIELRQALPFDVATNPRPLLSPEEQADEWTKSFGAY